MLKLQRERQSVRRADDLDRVRNLEKQIAQVDAEIDQRVYALYGITEEEIKIVEGAGESYTMIGPLDICSYDELAMNRSFSRHGLMVLIVVLLSSTLLAIYVASRPRLAPGQKPLTDVQNIETLRTQFNQDIGQTRLIILVSPTGGECLVGARGVQTQILAHYPSAPLHVYAVWLPMLWGDSREAWNDTNMPAPRVMHFWDGELQLGKWFGKEVDGSDGVAWDVYYLFGPEAVWETVPQPLLGGGRTIHEKRETLKRQVGTLLGN